ncbi:hypothetical protein O3M35_001086 [Rhynocoris fuscipes]|uniref:CHK kinase-like domain-containing protein n=1 Tax=Rhynocoris fuscipes TaxID=488301 RepID=A0AAW1DNX4_9HEMI
MEENAWLETILKKNAYDKSISKVLNVSMESVVPEGNYYTSVIYTAKIDVLLRSGRKSKISLIIKTTHQEGDIAELLKKNPIFKGETKFYSDIFSKFDQLMDDYQDNREKLWCNMIGYIPYDTIAFDDLKAENYTMADRTKFLDKNHALLVLNSLGRFHAMGHVLMKKGLVSKEDFLLYYLEMDDHPVVNNMFQGGLKQLCHVMETEWPAEWNNVVNRLKAQIDVAVKRLKALFSKDTFQTICHGDCWTCNMMFKYCPYDEKVPVAMKFVDMQGAHLNSFGFDILHVLYTSVRSDIRNAYWNDLIKEYHRSLKSTMSLYEMEDFTPTLEKINEELKRLEYYSFIVNLLIFPIHCYDKPGAFKMENIDENRDGMNAFDPGIFNTDKYKTEVQKQLMKWLDEGLY